MATIATAGISGCPNPISGALLQTNCCAPWGLRSTDISLVSTVYYLPISYSLSKYHTICRSGWLATGWAVMKLLRTHPNDADFDPKLSWWCRHWPEFLRRCASENLRGRWHNADPSCWQIALRTCPERVLSMYHSVALISYTCRIQHCGHCSITAIAVRFVVKWEILLRGGIWVHYIVESSSWVRRVFWSQMCSQHMQVPAASLVSRFPIVMISLDCGRKWYPDGGCVWTHHLLARTCRNGGMIKSKYKMTRSLYSGCQP